MRDIRGVLTPESNLISLVHFLEGDRLHEILINNHEN